MAIVKNLELPNGAIPAYWRIKTITLNMDEHSVWYVLAGYRDVAAYDANMPPMGEKPVTIVLPDDVTFEQITRSFLYDYSKSEVEAFKGSTDDNTSRKERKKEAPTN